MLHYQTLRLGCIKFYLKLTADFHLQTAPRKKECYNRVFGRTTLCLISCLLAIYIYHQVQSWWQQRWVYSQDKKVAHESSVCDGNWKNLKCEARTNKKYTLCNVPCGYIYICIRIETPVFRGKINEPSVDYHEESIWRQVSTCKWSPKIGCQW